MKRKSILERTTRRTRNHLYVRSFRFIVKAVGLEEAMNLLGVDTL